MLVGILAQLQHGSRETSGLPLYRRNFQEIISNGVISLRQAHTAGDRLKPNENPACLDRIEVKEIELETLNQI